VLSTLDLNTTPANLTAGLLTVRTGSTSANTLTIGAGKKLTLTGGVLIGNNTGVQKTPDDDYTTVLNASGAGELAVTGGNFAANRFWRTHRKCRDPHWQCPPPSGKSTGNRRGRYSAKNKNHSRAD